MERSPLFWQVYDRLVADPALSGEVARLIEAAFDGAEAVESAARAEASRIAVGEKPKGRPAPARTSLIRLEVTGFRGIGPTVALDFDPGPGLTLIVGRNGSGKSSVAEALEVALTGENRRCKDRKKEWQSGWRNLHHPASAVAATFVAEGSTPLTVVRSWATDAVDLGAATAEVVRGSRRSPVEALGWADALVTHRPMLSYAELGRLLDDGPSKLYDELKALLGLDELGVVKGHLAAARKTREAAAKASQEAKAALLTDLAGLDDPRAEACRTALGKKTDLEAIRAAVRGGVVDPTLQRVQALAQLRGPDPEQVSQAVAGLRRALADRDALADTQATRARITADVLGDALEWHAALGDGACPVCATGSLDAAWAARATVELVALRAASLEADRARAAVAQAVNAATALMRQAPREIAAAAEPEFGAVVLERWAAFVGGPRLPSELADHLERKFPPLLEAIEALRAAATSRLLASEGRWGPVAERLRAWVIDAERVATADPAARNLKKAEDWIKDAEGALTAERFAPIELSTRQIWAQLRQESHVALDAVSLSGSATRRRVDLAVNVDGRGANALGVMSQGEINALALSLFIPRLAHAESPFRFLVIDDPVQAMDPYKVDGLARVLERTARDRQVIVLTHDDRLSDAVRRLQIPATVLEVVRRADSVVEVRPAMSPVIRPLEDASALVRSKVGSDVIRRVVPALCRSAVEARFREVIRRRRLGRGDSHQSVAAAIDGAHTTISLAALALFDDGARGADVFAEVKRLSNPGGLDLLIVLKEGAHGNYAGDPDQLIRETLWLTDRFARVQ